MNHPPSNLPADRPPVQPDPLMIDAPWGIYAMWKESPFLAGMPYPLSPQVWGVAAGLGIDSVVCLTDSVAGYNPSPLRLVHSVHLDDLDGGGYPEIPYEEEDRIRAAVKSVVGELAAGRSVVVHCEGGTGRTGTVIACVLREMGVESDAVLRAMERLNVVRGRAGRGWPESEWQRGVVLGW